MSKLETAFSKALNEQSPAAEQERKPVERSDGSKKQLSIGSGSEKALAKRTGLAVSSRGQIRQMTDGAKLSDEELEARGLIHPRMEDTKLLNIYRNLRTKLLSAADGDNFTTMVTSVVSSPDSSQIAANIAASFAFDEGKTAMLVEGDVHTCGLSRLFDLDRDAEGLMDYLDSDQDSLADVIHDTGIPRLRFIPGGRVREHSAEHFTSDRMRATIDEVLTRYPDRYPIIDAPSVQDSADARILLDLCDQVVFVVPYGTCTEDEIRNAAEIIGSTKLAGVVLDQF